MKRRAVLAGAGATVAAVAAGLYRFTDLFVKHFPPTPYDDVLNRIADREQAARLGAHVTGVGDARSIATALRPRLGGGVQAAVEADLAAGRLVEVSGWLMPQTVALMAALAARVQA